MKKTISMLLAAFLITNFNYAQKTDSTKLFIEAIEKSLVYKTGVVVLESGYAKLTVPDGFRYLDKKQSVFILTDLWGNPADSSVLGMLIPSSRSIMDEKSWAFIINYDDMGYVKDNDAGDINYNDLLKEMQAENETANPERVKQGFQTTTLVGWASTPYYDQKLKTLHWAKEIKFGDASTNTLNYNLRILGRKGVYNLNAVASMSELPEVKLNIDKIIRCVEFTEGYAYSDFNSSIDNISTWSIGGLVAGKVLAKVGFFALLAKFGKIIIFAIIAAFGGIWKLFKGSKNESTNENGEENNNV